VNMWQIKLGVVDGRVIITGTTEDIPPGELEIRGSDDGNRVTLEVKQRDTRGRFVASAHHRRDRAEEMLHDLEAAADEAIAVVAE
jgi:hypothetical protein